MLIPFAHHYSSEAELLGSPLLFTAESPAPRTVPGT